ncbi:DUF4238 domain-containing protein [Neobacillus endophyticus]|nr:DUF4238 domain-containing protein [Neobacillus endophyticus]
MIIEILVADKGSGFITSDNAVCRFKNNDYAIRCIFPIAPEIAL